MRGDGKLSNNGFAMSLAERTSLLSLASILVLCLHNFASAEVTPREWTVDGVKREALVFAPTVTSDKPSPLIFGFHGHGGTIGHAARTYRYQTLWPEAIVVYMQGLKTPGRLTDPEGKRSGWQAGPGAQDDRDLKFFDAVLASIKKEFTVDDARIYATGHSNGGGFTYLLWQERGDIFAAMAPSAAAALRSDAGKMKPKPILHVAGDNDPLVKYAWQKLMIAEVKKLNGCTEAGVPWQSSHELKGTKFESSKGAPLVTLIHSGEHKFLDETPPLIVKFFQEHSKK